MELTESMQDYLRLIYELGLDGEEVGVSALAGRLGISAPSVTGMAERLAKAGLVRRAPYRGLTLTEEGRKAALGVVRRHRLVELYLVDSVFSSSPNLDATEAGDQPHRLPLRTAHRCTTNGRDSDIIRVV